MISLRLLKYGGALSALAILSACGVLRQAQDDMALSPSASGPNIRYVGKTLFVNGRPVTAARLSRAPRYAALLPDSHTKSKKFEYVSNVYGNAIGIFDYPKSTQQIGTINDTGGAECANALYGYGKKYFWVVGGYNDIEEYEVIKKPIKTLSVPYSDYPSGCAMDTSGDLAVGILFGSGGGGIVIFKGASGSGIVVGTSLASLYFIGYDKRGNLFADGFMGGSYNFGLVELPKGSSTFVTIKTTNSPAFPGSVQWDGTYLTVFDQLTNELYQYTVSGTTATLKNTVQLNGSSDCAQTWIVKGFVYCADAGNDDVEIFKYPAGGSAIAVLTDNIDFPLGVTAAQK